MALHVRNVRLRTAIVPILGGVLFGALLFQPGFPALRAQEKPVTPKPDQLVLQATSVESFFGTKLDAELGFLTVPENRSNPNGASIKLAFARLKSTAKNPGLPVFYLAGGPGAAAIPDSGRPLSPVIEAMREIGDVVLLDQRGTGRTEPSLVVPGALTLPLDKDAYDPDTIQTLEKTTSEIAKTFKAKGIDLSAYNTNESADDVNDLRAALGYPKINLWGHSYGSHLGLAVIRRHGETIHRAILGGINGPDHRWRFPSDGERFLNRLADRIKAHPVLGKEMPDLTGELRTVLERLEKQPVKVDVPTKSGSVTVTVGPNDVRIIILMASGEIEFVRTLPILVRSMSRGDFARMGDLVLNQLKNRGVGTAMRYAMVLASGVSDARRAKIAEELKAGSPLLGDAINYPFNFESVWKSWEIRDLGPDYRELVKSNVPTLFLSGTLDGRTSLEDAAETAAGFSNRREVVIDGASHDFYLADPRIKDVMLDFFRSGTSTTERISVPFEFRGPNERAQIEELRKFFLDKGIEAGVKRFKAMTSPNSGDYVTSYVLGTLGFRLMNLDKKIAEAEAVIRLNAETFPDSAFTHYSLGELSLKSDDKRRALAHFKKAVELNPYEFQSVRRINELKTAANDK